MQNLVYKTVEEYMIGSGIDIGKDFSFNKRKFLKSISQDDVENQLYIISQFHIKMKHCDKCILQRINNETGKLVEQYKVELNKVKRYIKHIGKSEVKNNFEKVLMEDGEKFIKIGDKCIEEIYQSGYIDIIVRSMDHGEMCLGDTYFTNLSYQLNKLQVKDISKISYNTVEMDGFYLLDKLNRKGISMNWREIISKFCNYENLDARSEKLIIALMNYPYDFVKCCGRYRNGKKNWDNKKFEEKLRQVIKDGANII